MGRDGQPEDETLPFIRPLFSVDSRESHLNSMTLSG
jgi:hypothetical protein